MITPGDVELGDAREQAECGYKLWAAVLGQVVADGDADYIGSAAFNDVCRIMGLHPEWAARQMLKAMGARAVKEKPAPKERQPRKHSDETREKLRAAAARRRARPEYQEWLAAVRAGAAKRWARERGEAVAA